MGVRSLPSARGRITAAFYPMSSATVKAFQDQLKGFGTSKGTIRFATDKPLPMALVKKLVKARIAASGG